MVYIPECKQQLIKTEIIRDIAPLNLGCSFIALRELCNNQRPRCGNAWIRLFNRGIEIT